MTGWIAVSRGVDINYDLEKSPLQIRTNSPVGSHEEVRVKFSNGAGVLNAGGFSIYFNSIIYYQLEYCNQKIGFPSALPSETDKIWTITLIKSSGIRFIIHCNNKEVLNVVLSSTICTSTIYPSIGSNIWSTDVGKINFGGYDTASDSYRAGK